jgi:HD-GYP domain-containing protein (c-di-GMP phosphodiesterase class II)
MTWLPVSELIPGMKLAKDVILQDGRLLLLSGFVIKPIYIRKLQAFNIEAVDIVKDSFTPIEEFYEEKLYKHAHETIKKIFSQVRNGKDTDMSVVKETVVEIIEKVMDNETVLLQLTGIRDIDNYTFLHSVDVCIFATIMGKKMGFGKDILVDLGMGAILHDIGKCKVPQEILKKPGVLTDIEFREMKLHPVYGCEIINSVSGLNSKIAGVAFQHHEKWDGTGYPLGIRDKNINPFSRIVTLADVYDALTSDRIYKVKELPHIAADYIKRNSGVLFDPDIVDLFVSNIAAYANGTIVLLNTGELGSIISSDIYGDSRQRVFIFSNRSGPPLLHPYTLDLNEHTEIDIIEIFV